MNHLLLALLKTEYLGTLENLDWKINITETIRLLIDNRYSSPKVLRFLTLPVLSDSTFSIVLLC